MRKKKLSIFLSLLAVSVVGCLYAGADGFPTGRINSIQTIISDMEPPHQGLPRGVSKNFDWAKGPRIGIGDEPKKSFRAMIAWGQVYEAEGGNPASNSRVQIRNIKAYLLSKRDRRWHLLQSSRLVEGAAFREDFAGDVNKPAKIRYEKDGSISVKAGAGYNYHFWTKSGRSSINPDDIGGIFTTVQARLIADDRNQPNDFAKARYLLSMGGDYWQNLTVKWDKWKTNGDIAIGKFKYVTPEWQAFNMTTLSPAKIQQNPPPIE